MKRFCIIMIMTFGVLVFVAPSSATLIRPEWIDGNPKIEDYCPECSLSNDKIEPVTDGTFGPLHVGHGRGAAGQMFDWTSTSYIAMILVKGGPNANLYEYGCSPGATSGTGRHAPTNPSGKYAGLSHISYCTNAPVPEPCTMLLFGAGIAGLGVFRKKFNKI